ncbi:hypothetical protein AVEN_68095-1 [Araneus ventricosus]|uniref:Uncharacterized protein n=1 Tax=Araneus ventricosus TaxID=182803 RepID=A0A4Y2UW98_ARAVE|nr:hypothetical protein AVEN_68095-1 [Araneus ventricosus]
MNGNLPKAKFLFANDCHWDFCAIYLNFLLVWRKTAAYKLVMGNPFRQKNLHMEKRRTGWARGCCSIFLYWDFMAIYLNFLLSMEKIRQLINGDGVHAIFRMKNLHERKRRRDGLEVACSLFFSVLDLLPFILNFLPSMEKIRQLINDGDGYLAIFAEESPHEAKP